MKGKPILVNMLSLGLLMFLAVGLSLAQGPRPPGMKTGVENKTGLAGGSDYLPVQGRLTDASGNPLDGTYSLTFRLYDVSTGGTPLCSDTNSVDVENGLFSTYIKATNCHIDGRQLYFSVEVEGDGEMSPRQYIDNVPYAWSLRPGAIISDTRDIVLKVQSTGTGDNDAFIADASGTGEAIEAYATDGIGVFAKSDTFVGLQAYTYDPNNDHPGVFGCAAESSGTCDPYRDDNGAGVMGYSQYDFGGYFTSGASADGGVYAEANGSLRPALWAENIGGGFAIYAKNSSSGSGNATLYLVQGNSGGDFVVAADSYLGDRKWRVDSTGKGFFDGGYQTGGADFAEQMAVEGEEADYEPGDVLVISASADRMVELSTEPFATAVIGVHSTQPAVLAGAPDTDDPLEGIPVALTGIVPCKVSAENGPIHRGDLLVTSSTPGHAMRAGDNPPQGTVLGKALGELEEGTGVILVLVTLQ